MREGKGSRTSLESLVPPFGTGPATMETVRVTPKLAQDWLDRRTPGFQRKLYEWHIDELVSYLRSGHFNTDEPITFKTVEGHPWLLDGQHRLHAIARWGGSVDMLVLTSPGTTMDDLRHDYIRMDSGLSRSRGDTIHALGLVEDLNLSQQEIAYLVAAVRHVENGFRPKREAAAIERSHDVLERRARDWADAAYVYLNAIRYKSFIRKRLFTAPVMSVGIVTCNDCPTKAVPFWKTIVQVAGLLPRSPEHSLVEFLMSTKVHQERERYSYIVAEFWNAYIEDRTPVKPSRVDSSRPFRLAETSITPPTEG